MNKLWSVALLDTNKKTGLYFDEIPDRMLIMYTELYAKRIDGIDREQYMGLLKELSNTNGKRYDSYKLLLFKRKKT